MCYTISNTTKDQQILEKKLGATYPKKLGQLKVTYSVSGFSHPNLPILTAEQPHEFQLYNWGLIPGWTPNPELAKQFSDNNLNSKSETIFEKPSFKAAVQKQRCLVPVTGFFEWRTVNKNKYPYYIHLKNEDIFCLAGIYDTWVNKETGELKDTFSIITTEANPLMAKIHNVKLRMPLILPENLQSTWLDPNLKETEIQSLMQPFSDTLMTAHTISKRITSRIDNPDAPETLQPFEYPELALADC